MGKPSGALNRKHLANPLRGDFWHEMFTPICAVVNVKKDGSIVICETIKSVDAQHWTWDVSKTRTVSKAEFAKKLTYDTIPDTCWCNVVPRRDEWLREAVREQVLADLE